MAEFPELEKFLDNSITLPMPGRDGVTRKYKITGADYTALDLIAALVAVSANGGTEAQQQLISVSSDREQMDAVFGKDVMQALIDDGVPVPVLQHATETVTAFHIFGEERALAVWSGKAHRPTLSAKTGGAAGTAQKPASTSGTTTRRKSAKPEKGRK